MFGYLPLHIACEDAVGGHSISIEVISALANEYREAISTMDIHGLMPSHFVEIGEHPDWEEILRKFDNSV